MGKEQIKYNIHILSDGGKSAENILAVFTKANSAVAFKLLEEENKKQNKTKFA